MKKLLVLMVAVIALVACGNRKQEQKTSRVERVGVPKELESRFFDSFEGLYDYLSAPIDSANRAILPKRWFVLPERCKDNEMMVRLVDDYNAFAVLNEIRTIVEEGMRFDIEQKERIESIDCSVVSNPKVVEWLEDVRLKALDFSSDYTSEEKDEAFFNAYWEISDKLMQEYHVSTFTDLTIEEYTERLTRTNFVAEYDSLAQFACSGDSLYLNDRIWDIAECGDITAKCLHAYLYLWAVNRDESHFLPVLEYLMEQKEASPYLPLVWRCWRCIYQEYMGGISKDSDIYNDYYNVRRLQCAETLFDYIENHPEDGVMINEFLVLATNFDIFRYGAFDFGNQVVVERYEILPMCGFGEDEE